MSRLILGLFLAVCLVACSTRNVVVAPDAVPKLNDSKWTIKAEPAARPR
ncbi:MAG TPA: hypothetical protein VIG07_06750 [Methylomirabilota bacterium]|jgi:hypothetical protein